MTDIIILKSVAVCAKSGLVSDLARQNRRSTKKKPQGYCRIANNSVSISDIVHSFKRLLRKPAYLVLIFALTFNIFSFSALGAQGFKYLTLQFHLTASQATLVAGERNFW